MILQLYFHDTFVIHDMSYSNISSNILGFIDKNNKSIFVGFSFNNSIILGFPDKDSQSIFIAFSFNNSIASGLNDKISQFIFSGYAFNKLIAAFDLLITFPNLFSQEIFNLLVYILLR